jgi:uncharacterized protein DUF2750
MTAGAHAHAFYRDAAKFNDVFTVARDGAPMLVDGASGPVLPVWSSRSRAAKIVATVPGYSDLVVVGMPWDEFERTQLPELEREGILLGVNWAGKNANGYELAPRLVAANVRAASEK